MSDDPRVRELLDLLSDSDATPEDVCGSCPELLPVVRDRWRQMCRAREELDDLFPPEDGSGPVQLDTTSLPVIPGYEVEAELGHGGMGVVYRARHVRLNRVIALKMVQTSGSRERERFRREAEAAAALRHPNVVQVHDVGEADGRPYFTMEYLEGGSLAQKLEGKPLPIREAASLLLALTGAVEAAHQSGIVHRDLKPANVMLTPDGTPKVADFGLARRLDGEAGLTRTGTAVGTPSYMAPEQAGENKSAPGPPADVYSLGAILYELLTGRPPFQAGNAAVTIYRALTQDPVRPSRLNEKVPQDLETICLKCLGKEPRLRYPSAAAVGDELRRFLDGEAIAARPEGPLARLVRRVRRRPVLSAAVAVAVLSTLSLIAGGVWAAYERQAAERAADLKQAAADAELRAVEHASDADLREMEAALKRCSWPAATAALERAKTRLGSRGSLDLHSRIERGTRDLELITRWEVIRLNSFITREWTGGQETVDATQADGEYEEAFQAAGFGRVNGDPETVVERIRTSHLRNFLAAELDYWAMMAKPDSDRRTWLLDVARRAFEDTAGWRARAVIRANWQDESSLGKLVASAPDEYPPLLILHRIDYEMTRMGKDSAPMMRRYQQAHADNFWVNLRLADILTARNKPEDAIRYYQAALAVRPKTAMVCNNLGVALARAGRRDEALEQYRRAVKFDPNSRLLRTNLVVHLSRSKLHTEVIEQALAALRIDARKDQATAWVYTALGNSLRDTGKVAEAPEAFRNAVTIDAKNLTAQSGLRDILFRQGKPIEARAAWEEALKADPPEHDAWYGYAELCLFLGKEEEYRRARRALLAKFGKETDPSVAERTSRACLLLPLSGDDLERAVALAGRAAAADRSKAGSTYPYYLFAKGLAEFRQGHFDRTIAIMKEVTPGVFAPTPRLVLAMALHKSGRAAEARKTLSEAILSHDWRAEQVRDQDGWIYHSLRREAEGMILPDLAAFLEGKYRPQSNDERLALLGVCQFTNRTVAMAQLYADAFVDAPRLAEDIRGGHRSNAARYAAQAGCGRGADAVGLRGPERAKWRAQALEWMRTDLAARSGALPQATKGDREWLRQKVAEWVREPDLAGVREPTELEKLPADERKDWAALWSEVNALLGRAEGGR